MNYRIIHIYNIKYHGTNNSLFKLNNKSKHEETIQKVIILNYSISVINHQRFLNRDNFSICTHFQVN